MRTWFRCLYLVVLILGAAFPAFGGGIDNKQNYSAAYVGSLSRNGATDGADVAAYNPGGIMLLKNGLHLALDAQPFTFDYDHTYNGETYTASPDIIVAPSAFVIHKSDRWAAWGAFTINGGGGETDYTNGNIITETIKNSASLGIFTNTGYTAYEAQTGTTRPNSAILLPDDTNSATLTNPLAYAESYDYTLTTGLAYKINSIFSIAAGARYVWTDKNVDIRGVYNYTFMGTPGSESVVGKYEQEADGFGGIFGINIHLSDSFNIGIRYDTKVKLDWETTVDSATKGTVAENILWMNGRVDGQSYARDLPAVLGIGFEWRVLPKFTVKPSYTLFFEKDADWGSQNGKVYKNSYDLGLGLQYDVTERWALTAGYLYIDVGINPDDYGIIERMNPPLDCHAFSLGTKYKMTERLLLTVAFAGYFYEDATASTVSLGAATLTPEVTYDKTLYQGGIGIQYSFL